MLLGLWVPVAAPATKAGLGVVSAMSLSSSAIPREGLSPCHQSLLVLRVLSSFFFPANEALTLSEP